MATGLALRQRMITNARGALGKLGKTTATAAATDRLTDTLRWNMNTLSPEDVSGRFLRLTQVLSGTASGSGATSLTDASAPFTASALVGCEVIAYTAAGLTTVGAITANTTTVLTVAAGWSNGTPAATSAYTVNYSHIAVITRPDTDLGALYFDPPVTTAVFTGTQYEIWAADPDDVDRAKDYALTRKCAPWRNKPLSVIKEVADWTVASAVNATASVQTLDFPREMFARSMLVTNSGAAGYVPSESYNVQPTQTYTIFGRVSVRAQTASIRFRDITNGADITLTGTSTFTLRGDQWFKVTAIIPASCGEVQLWLGGASASCIAEWSGVGLLPAHETLFSLENRLLSKHDVGDFWAYDLPTTPTGRISREPLYASKREHAGNGVTVLFDSPPGIYPVYYQERHRYAALQSDYLSLNDRATGDGTSTDCDIDYAAWAATVELLEARKRTDELDRLLAVAYKDLRAWDREVGADPIITSESRSQGGIGVLSL